jgi:GTP-binding protein EngB required for normal cell division
MIINAHTLANQLTKIIHYLKNIQNGKLDLCKDTYRNVISKPSDNNDIGSFYILLCEDLQLKIWNAEYRCLFPNTNTKLEQWLHQQGSTDKFESKVPVLLEAIEQDLINQYSNPYLAARIKIGVIGYTSSGKSSLINRLLGIQSLEEDGAAPVSDNKSTYFPLHYDRREPLINPDNWNRRKLVTFVDIQGLDNNRISDNTKVQAGNYLDEIRKADCDIYIVVFDDELSEQQQMWIEYIEELLKRKCVLVRSKVDCDYLQMFHKYSGTYFASSNPELRAKFHRNIMKQLREDTSIKSRDVYLVACYYSAPNSDAHKLQELKEQLFDFPDLLNTLGRLAYDAQHHRIHRLATRIIARAINTSFRRGYVLNVMKYKLAAGFASIIPFGDQLPRYLSRDGIRDAFGIDETFCQYLKQFHLIIYNYKLQTSVFEDCVEIKESQMKSKLDAKWVGRTAGAALIVGGAFGDDVLRGVAPAAIALSGVVHVIFTVATIGLGVAISAAVCAWSAIDSGKHIFSYINRVCDDIIMITDPLIMSIIEREREKVSDENQSTASTNGSL